MTDISVIVLVGQEKIHLKRCIEKLAPLEPKCIWLIESQPDDGGVEIAKEAAERFGLTLKTVYNEWPGLYAKQFNWALDEVEKRGGGGQWILRLDADEYLTEDTIEKLKEELPRIDQNVNGLKLLLKRKFFGKEVKYGVRDLWLLRIWRTGRGRLENRAMDEHVLVDGEVINFNGAFYDDNLNSFEWWQNKHRGYAKREALDAVELFNNPERLAHPTATDLKKMKYYKLPPYFRAFLYFCLRYFVGLGFRDGWIGLEWNFWQGFWYRCLVDKEIGKLRNRLK